MQHDLNTTTAKRTGARRSVQTVVAAIVLCLLAFPANGQGAILNEFQRKLLELERETAIFDPFFVDVVGVQLTRMAGQAIRQAELDELKGAAELLLALLEDIKTEARALVGADFSSSTAAGIELDTETLYRISAHNLNWYFNNWDIFLRKIVTQGEVTSPVGFWNRPGEQLLTDAQIYRQLANIQYRLDQLEAE